jgi:hypothetical protein
MARRSHIEKGQRELGTDELLTGVFKAQHDPSVVTGAGVINGLGLFGVVAANRRSPEWVPLDDVPTGKVTVGVTTDEVLIGRNGDTYQRLSLADAFGDANLQLIHSWIEIGGVKFGVEGADADEAMRIWRENRSNTA